MSPSLCEDIRKAYEEQTLWRKTTFSPPSGHAGTEYVKEHTRLLRAYKDRTPLECIALQAIMVMPSLLLQRPHAKAGSKEFSQHLSRRLSLWKDGNIKELLEEARTIQSRLPALDRQRNTTATKLNRRFAALIGKGAVHSAISLITEHGKGGVLDLTPTVRAALRSKHPQAKPANPEVLIQGEVPTINPILFESLTGDVVRKTALATQGAAGPSMGDAYVWRRMLLSFRSASKDLCDAVAEVARHLASQQVDPAGLLPLLNNRLIPLDKNPGVRPVGIGEVLRRIIGKSLLSVLKNDIVEAAGASQVCAGHPSGCDAAIHALRQVFDSVGSDAVLLVDADNAFNRLNRAVALHNIRYVCPPISTILTNIYRSPSRLFVTGGMELSSEEGTTQGCPLSMAMYALSSVPLIDKCQHVLSNGDTVQVWYADDAAAGGNLSSLRNFWDVLVQYGPAYGYFPKSSKTFLVVKPEYQASAVEEFSGSGVQLVEDEEVLTRKDGQRHLGAAVGSPDFVAAYLDEKVASWAEQVTHLADIAATQPHAAYAGFVFGLRHRWSFIQRTMPTAGVHMQPLKDAIDHKLLPALVNHELSDMELDLLRMPARFGGMSFENPVVDSKQKYIESIECTANLTQQILGCETDLMECIESDRKRKATGRQGREAMLKVKADDLQRRLPEAQRRAMVQAREKGGSSILTTIPVAEHGFYFDVKADFHDHIHLRYCWPLDNLPFGCPCGKPFTIDHAQICKLSGFIHMRHDDPTDFIASCMKEVYNDVEIEPKLQPLTGETFQHRTANTDPDARADIRVRGFWTQGRNAFFDTRVFYPYARSYQSKTLRSLLHKVEGDKKREYRERINEIEHGSFTPLVFSSCGAMGQEATVVIKKLADVIATKRNESYTRVVGWMRCSLAFSLARSAIRCVRGSRSIHCGSLRRAPVDLVYAEAQLEGS